MNRKGIIDVITLVLLVVIAIAAVAAVWMWMSGFLGRILPPATNIQPISVVSLTCDSSPAAGRPQIEVMVRNLGGEQIPPGEWVLSVERLNISTGSWGEICKNVSSQGSINPRTTLSLSISCAINADDELTIRVNSPQGATASGNCRAVA